MSSPPHDLKVATLDAGYNRMEKFWKWLGRLRRHIVAVVLVVSAFVAGSAALLANIKSIGNFFGIPLNFATITLAMLDSGLAHNTVKGSGPVVYVTVELTKAGSPDVRGCKFGAWLGNPPSKFTIDITPNRPFDIPVGKWTQNSELQLLWPRSADAKSPVRLAVFCDQAASESVSVVPADGYVKEDPS